MYKLNNGFSQEKFNGLELHEVVSRDMVKGVGENNPLGLSDGEIMKLLNLSWKYEKPMNEVLKDCFLKDFAIYETYQNLARNHKYRK